MIEISKLANKIELLEDLILQNNNFLVNISASLFVFGFLFLLVCSANDLIGGKFLGLLFVFISLFSTAKLLSKFNASYDLSPWFLNKKNKVKIKEQKTEIINLLSQLTMQRDLINFFQSDFSDETMNNLKILLIKKEYDKVISAISDLFQRLNSKKQEQIENETFTKMIAEYDNKIKICRYKL